MVPPPGFEPGTSGFLRNKTPYESGALTELSYGGFFREEEIFLGVNKILG